MDFNMDAEIVVTIGDTFDDYEDLDLGWGGPNFYDGSKKSDAEFIYIDNLINNKNEL